MTIKHLTSKNVQDSEQRAKKKQAVPLRTVHFGALVDAHPSRLRALAIGHWYTLHETGAFQIVDTPRSSRDLSLAANSESGC